MPPHEDPSCRSIDQLHQEAELHCKDKGQGLQRATYVGACVDGRYRGVVEQCADATSTQAQKCSSIAVGDGQSCLDYGQLTELAAEACSAEGPLALADLAFASDCADGYATSVKALCCEAPPPSEEVCSIAVVGSGEECVVVLTNIAFAEDSADGGSTRAKALCCSP